MFVYVAHHHQYNEINLVLSLSLMTICKNIVITPLDSIKRERVARQATARSSADIED